MQLTDLIGPDRVIPRLQAANKKQVLHELARKAEEITGVSERKLFDVLLERERLGSTGIGAGIAIPHAKLKEIDRLYGVVARVDPPVDFEAIDGQPVDLVFLLLAPESAGADHLTALARISRLARDGVTCRKLRGSTSAEAIYLVLSDEAASHAA